MSSKIEGKTTQGIILQTFTFEKPTGHALRMLFLRLGAELTVNVSSTRGIIDGEWGEKKNDPPLVTTTMELWKNAPANPHTLKDATEIFEKCSRARILEILTL